jgi:glycosyltransferase involved in cell wall biosynthesis
MTQPLQGQNAPKRITFLINSMEGGGAERAMANLLHFLLPRLPDHMIELVVLDDLVNKQDLPEGLNIVQLNGRGKMLHSRAELHKHWRSPDHRPDICVSFLARANVLNVWLARRIGHRAIISERVNTSSHIAASRAAPFLAAITRATYPRADRLVAVSQGVADDLSRNFKVSPSKISVIGNPIDRDRLTALASAPKTLDLPKDYFLGLGRLVKNKNFSLLLDAYAQAATGIDLVILGQGPEDAALKAQADALGIRNKVHFAGFVDNPYPVMAHARALISASRAEGFPNTLIEAMTLGCPVVATDCPSGPADVLASVPVTGPPWSPTAHGILIAMEDQNAMAAAITALCDDDTQRDFTERAKLRSAKYGVSEVVDGYLGILLKRETQC